MSDERLKKWIEDHGLSESEAGVAEAAWQAALSAQPSPGETLPPEMRLSSPDYLDYLDTKPSPDGQDALLGYVRIEAIKALREDDEVTGVMVHVEERTNSLPVYLAARQPVDFDDKELQFYREHIGNDLDNMLMGAGVFEVTHEGGYEACWTNSMDALKRLIDRKPVEFERAIPTRRRESAVELLLQLGFVWNNQRWEGRRQTVDSCTESECKRCRAHPDHRGSMEHAGISDFRQPVGSTPEWFELVIRDVCELDPEDPDAAGTVCIRLLDLRLIMERHALPAHAVDLGQLIPRPKAVPDEFAEDDSDAQYNSGWNDCRDAVLALIESHKRKT